MTKEKDIALIGLGTLAGALAGSAASSRSNKADLINGLVPTYQLGSGTADNTKFLRGDSSWQQPSIEISNISISLASFIIYMDGVNTKAINGTTGVVDYSNVDSSTVIQNAINALLPNGGLIHIRNGTYNISSTINLREYMTIEGEGHSTILQLSNNANSPIFKTSNTSYRKITIRNMQLNGNKANNPLGTGIETNNFWFSRIQNMTIRDFGGYGIHSIYNGDSHDNWIENVYILDGDGIAADISLTDTFITDCNFSSLKQALISKGSFVSINGLHTWGTNGYNEIEILGNSTVINNAIIESNSPVNSLHISGWGGQISNIIIDTITSTGNGIFVDNSNWSITNSRILNAGTNGIYLHKDRNLISDCYIYNSGQHGIYDDAGINIINGCIIEHNSRSVSNTYDGINLATTGNIVSNNILRDWTVATQRYGIYDGNGFSSIQNNKFSGNATGAMFYNTNSMIRNNYAFKTENNVISNPFAIDSIGIKTVTVPHGLAITPRVQDCYLTVIQNTDVDDWYYNMLKVVSTDASDVIAKINVSSPSSIVGSTAKLGLRVGNP